MLLWLVLFDEDVAVVAEKVVGFEFSVKNKFSDFSAGDEDALDDDEHVSGESVDEAITNNWLGRPIGANELDVVVVVDVIVSSLVVNVVDGVVS